MQTPRTGLFSSQTEAIYRLLTIETALTAREIAERLHILPHAVYRAVKPLIETGIVAQISRSPITYSARPLTDAIDIISATVRKNFQDAFTGPKNEYNRLLDVSFITGRVDLLEKTNSDTRKSAQTISFIVSGLEVPADTILDYKRAVDRGVHIRALVQRLDDTSEEMFRNWKKIGVEVKYYPNMEARIFIFDEQIVYFTSYNPHKKEEAFGIRFNYIPYAKLMNETFEKRWSSARGI